MPYPCNSHKRVLGPRLLPHFLDEKIGSWELKQTEQRLVSRAIWFHLLLGDSHKKTSLRNSGLSTSIIRYFHPLWGQRKPPLNHGKLGGGNEHRTRPPKGEYVYWLNLVWEPHGASGLWECQPVRTSHCQWSFFFPFPRLSLLPLFISLLSYCLPLNEHFHVPTMYKLCARSWDAGIK